MDYRNSTYIVVEESTADRSIFVDDMVDNGVFNLVVGNDNNRGDGGRPKNDERQSRIDGIHLRDNLRDELGHHDLHRPRNNNE